MTRNEEKLAKALGWFSIGLGLTQLLAPGWLGRQIGVGERTGAMRALGARETLTGLSVLNPRVSTAGLWGRVGGDLMDLALLAGAFRSPRAQRNRVIGAVAAVAGVALLDLVAARMNQRRQSYAWSR
jgi:hypothetical protein